MLPPTTQLTTKAMGKHEQAGGHQSSRSLLDEIDPLDADPNEFLDLMARAGQSLHRFDIATQQARGPSASAQPGSRCILPLARG